MSEPSKPKEGYPGTPGPSGTTARVRLPNWLFGFDVAGFASKAGWLLEKDDAHAEEWRIRLKERGEPDRRPGLVKVSLLATSANRTKPEAWTRLSHLTEMPPSSLSPDAVRLELRRLDGLAASGDFSGALARISISTTLATNEQLPDVLKANLGTLLSVSPGSAIYLIDVSPELTWRYAATRALLLADEDPDFINHVKQDGQLIFNSARGLLNDTTLGLGAYLGPLFLSCAPWVWGMSSGRPGGVIAYTFGGSLSGRKGEAAELLQYFSPGGRSPVSSPRPTFRAKAIGAAMRWYVKQLDELFSEATDPCAYTDGEATLEVRSQLMKLLTLEQAFRNLQSLSSLDRDAHARRVLALDTLDTLEGLKLGASFKEMTTHSWAVSALAELEASLPSDVGSVLLPRARAGVDALAELQKGFFIRSRLNEGEIRLPRPSGSGEENIPLEQAAAAWLRVLRNAGHGFDGRRQASQRSRDLALTVAHDAAIPGDLPDLTWLYVLRLLATPSLLHRTNHRRRSARDTG